MAKKRRRQQRARSGGRPTGVQTAERPPGQSATGRSRPASETPPRPSRGPAASQRSRAEKKELARQEREAARRRIARARRTRQLVRIGAIVAVVGLAVFWFTRPDEPPQHRTQALPGELTTDAPWPANTERLAARLNELGLPPEGTTMHEHANVQVFINGDRTPVPANIGVGSEAAPLHTHEDSGTVHIESLDPQTFFLGQFFDVWGVRLTPSCIGGYCNDGDQRLRVFVDGKPVQRDPRDIALEDQSVIVLTYGTEAQLPDPIPSEFDFSSVPQ